MAFNLILKPLNKPLTELASTGTRVLLMGHVNAGGPNCPTRQAMASGSCTAIHHTLESLASRDPSIMLDNHVVWFHNGRYLVTPQFTNGEGSVLMAQRPLHRPVITTVVDRAWSALYLLHVDGNVEPLDIPWDHTLVLKYSRQHNLLIDPTTVRLLPKKELEAV